MGGVKRANFIYSLLAIVEWGWLRELISVFSVCVVVYILELVLGGKGRFILLKSKD